MSRVDSPQERGSGKSLLPSRIGARSKSERAKQSEARYEVLCLAILQARSRKRGVFLSDTRARDGFLFLFPWYCNLQGMCLFQCFQTCLLSNGSG